ncbi:MULTISPECIES: universal stress protein [Streptomyces]|uniref:Universal stress protein n=1 Tax=Streptomyces mutomycini TaxID=284036 RepID=A0ABW0B127_9ACTN|nr:MULTISPECIES: universal stress protein [Streptomyces]KPC78393.1 universal stress protein UspA [Streptomyces sp. NRRL S-4]
MRTPMSGATGRPRTVVGVDGSEQARAAALWGAADAARLQHGLFLVHATNLDRLDRFASFETSEHVQDKGNALLAEAEKEIRRRFPSLDLTVKMSRRNPVSALHAAARPGDTIVVGSRGSGGFGPLLLGSTGLEAAVGSPVPVIVVRGESGREDGAPVTAAVRDEHDAVWLARTAREAKARGCALRLLNVRRLLAGFGGRPALPEDAGGPGEQLTDDLAARLRAESPGLTVRTEVVTARSVASALVDASREAGLLVMGSHERRGMSVLGLGHVVHAALHHSHCPVQIVPYARDSQGVSEEGLGESD